MLLKNNTKSKFVHSYFNENYKLQMLILEPKRTLEVPEDVAKSWLKVPGIEEYIEPSKIKEKEEKLIKEIEKLKEENAELKKEDKKAKTSKRKSKNKK